MPLGGRLDRRIEFRIWTGSDGRSLPGEIQSALETELTDAFPVGSAGRDR